MFRSPQVILFSKDVARAAAFYAGLGFTETFRVPTEGEPIHVDLVLDGYKIGIAAVASAAGRNRGYDDGYVYRGRGYDDRYYNGRYNNAGSSRQAVEQCVNAAQRNANRYSYGGNARVTDIREIDRKRDGYTVKGRIAVNSRNADWRRGWGNDYRGWNDNYRGYDAGKFTCKVRYGRVVDLDYSGIRGL